MFKLNEHLHIQPSILAVSLVSLVVMMGSTMVTPSLTLYAKQDLGANEFLVGAVIAGFAIGRLIFDVPAGFLADRLGLNRAMILGLGILIGASTLAGFASSYWVLLFARLLEGVASSIYVSAAIAFVLLSSDAAKRGTNIGSYQSILMLGPIVGPVVGAPIAEFFGYNAPYFAFAALIFGAAVIMSIFSRHRKFNIEKVEEEHEHENREAGMAAYLNTAAIATFGFAFLRSGIYTTGVPLFAYGSLNLSVFDMGIILTMASLANLISSFFSGRLTQSYGMQKPLFGAILISGLLVAIIPLSTSMVYLLVVITLIGITSGFFGQSIAWAAEQIEEKVKRIGKTNFRIALGVQSHVTRGIGFNRMIGDLGLILGPLFIGYFITVFSKDPLVWFISFGSTSGVLVLASFLILGTKVKVKSVVRTKR
ncbi:MAG: putative major facilitator superfamily 1 [Nitrososphaera sp.]|jgi:MFS family permease|nr:putative major facilitator superfamily 1 [Nitrososphaera sp.]